MPYIKPSELNLLLEHLMELQTIIDELNIDNEELKDKVDELEEEAQEQYIGRGEALAERDLLQEEIDELKKADNLTFADILEKVKPKKQDPDIPSGVDAVTKAMEAQDAWNK